MKISVQPWSPEYSAELDLSPDEASIERIDTSCEAGSWEPRLPGRIGRLGELPIAFVDGTRRIDARLFVSDNGSAPVAGLAGSVGVGAVVCDPAGSAGSLGSLDGPPRRADIARCVIERFVAAGDGLRTALTGSLVDYRPLPVAGTSVDELVGAIHEAMRSREAAVAQDIAGDHLVFVDGPLAVMHPDPAPIVGVIKSHQRRYLDEEHETILSILRCGSRTPLFAFGEPRPRYSWYLRLCDLADEDHPWHGLVRCEVPAVVGRGEAVALADASAALLPLFASEPYWDARAPQNLVPVAGLEKRLRHLLGDRELVLRLIRSAAAAPDGGTA